MNTKSLGIFLREGTSSKPVLVAPPIVPSDYSFWSQANREILWGWKRDAGIQSRVVYYSGHLNKCKDGIAVEDSFFFYKHRTNVSFAQALQVTFEEAMKSMTRLVARPNVWVQSKKGSNPTVFFKFGIPREEDIDRVRRLVIRRPRQKMKPTSLPEEANLSQALPLFPMDLYAGSGVSYEAGLPTLCEVHDFFCLDNHRTKQFTLGNSDHLPLWFASNPLRVIQNFCRLHTMALSAQPTAAQQTIAELYKIGLIQQVFSDNVDNLLCKVDVPFVRTRGSGVFNERFPATFKSRTLLVVGVAADRRQLIQQARGRNMNIIIVDPCAKVSHGVQHLNYVRPCDYFFRSTAQEFFSVLRQGLKIAKDQSHTQRSAS